jgi:hypothetical protein
MLRYMLLPFLIFSLIITAIYSLSVLREGGRGRAGGDKPSKIVSISRMQGVRIINTRDGMRQWMLRSGEIEIEGDRVKISGVDADVMGVEMEVRSSEGSYDMVSGDLALAGGVNILGDNYSIETPEASLEPSSGSLYSEGEVVIEGRNFRISGTGLLAQKQEIRILRDVQAVFY